jgi:NADP-dependent aldehyde dehydrogenase
MPPGIFSLVQSTSHTTGEQLVAHPYTKAVGFTGSFGGGMAIGNIAQKRKEPIPVFLEMGSINPAFLFPEYLAANLDKAAVDIQTAIIGSMGQLCVKPGIIFVIGKKAVREKLFEKLGPGFKSHPGGALLTENMGKRYVQSVKNIAKIPGVTNPFGISEKAADAHNVRPYVLAVNSQTYSEHKDHFHEEIFGPYTLIVEFDDVSELASVISKIPGSLAGSIFATESELGRNGDVVGDISTRVGRLVYNNFSTAVEAVRSLNHGGPFPSTNDSRFTAVGTHAIKRWVRPVCYQNLPESLLPEELKNENRLNIWRTINNQLTKDSFKN